MRMTELPKRVYAEVALLAATDEDALRAVREALAKVGTTGNPADVMASRNAFAIVYPKAQGEYDGALGEVLRVADEGYTVLTGTDRINGDGLRELLLEEICEVLEDTDEAKDREAAYDAAIRVVARVAEDASALARLLMQAKTERA